MIKLIEQSYNQLPPFIQLPESIRQGLGRLWDKSTRTQTEWGRNGNSANSQPVALRRKIT